MTLKEFNKGNYEILQVLDNGKKAIVIFKENKDG